MITIIYDFGVDALVFIIRTFQDFLLIQMFYCFCTLLIISKSNNITHT